MQDLDGNSIHHLTIDKPSGTASINLADLNLSRNLTIDNGTFDLATFTCQIAGNTNINSGGILAIYDTGNDLASNSILWNSGSQAIVSAGTFHAGIWGFFAGCNAMIGTGNTAYLKNMYFPEEPTAHFGNLVIQPSGALLSNGARSNVPVNVAGDMTIQDGATWAFPGPTGMIVSDNSLTESGATLTFYADAVFNTGGTLDISGTLNLDSGASALLNGALIFPATGLLSIANESFINDRPDSGVWTNIYGTLNMSSGLFELSNNHPRFLLPRLQIFPVVFLGSEDHLL